MRLGDTLKFFFHYIVGIVNQFFHDFLSYIRIFTFNSYSILNNIELIHIGMVNPCEKSWVAPQLDASL